MFDRQKLFRNQRLGCEDRSLDASLVFGGGSAHRVGSVEAPEFAEFASGTPSCETGAADFKGSTLPVDPFFVCVARCITSCVGNRRFCSVRVCNVLAGAAVSINVFFI